MTKPVPNAAFTRLSPVCSARTEAGLPRAIDRVAERAAETHRFLRRQWFRAAVESYGGDPRTILVERDGAPLLALPITAAGPRPLKLVQIPGAYWPFRSFPVREATPASVYALALDEIAIQANALRIGPVYDDDASAMTLIAAARAAGWATLPRYIATSHLLDIVAARAAGPWPRTSTLKKNRFHEKHLGAYGRIDWDFHSGEDWTPKLFDALADVERASWIDSDTDGRDAKFLKTGHGAFWRAAADDPVLAQMMWAAVLRVDHRPVAFSFDINVGACKYAIANSFATWAGKHSPGKLLYYRNLIRAADDGITTVDWGAGDGGYKATIGADEGPAIRDWLLLRPGLPAAFGRVLAGVWRRSGNRA
ncbi:GNAT family N-acetyltransferase [uncultured Sphingomonas sp.]|uniref:GNAT family N-acetyltransferase n=1 Tax=uncultured Sphingomonas sp. TaxID=158754 RepID=UPI0025DCE229|nr:GNAT family N-acetyltransferase [uncultured Sphingomonas sp.]